MSAPPKVFILAHDEARESAVHYIRMKAPDGYAVKITEPNRTLEQNAAQWPILGHFSDQLRWPVNGEMVQMTDEEWKEVLTAAFYGDTVRLAMGLNGGVVMLGRRTSKFKVKEFSEWLEFLHMIAAKRGVDLTRKNEQG